jgi:8-oxo-dGTP diphosphatase
MKRFGPPPRPGVVYRRRAGVYAMLLRGDMVLLTHQSDPWPEFQLPGGGIDPGEGPLAALHREVAEETGWRIAAPRRVSVHRRFAYMPEYQIWAEKVCTIYLAQPVRRHGPPTEAGHSAVWMPLHLAAESVGSPGDRAALAALRDRPRLSRSGGRSV